MKSIFSFLGNQLARVQSTYLETHTEQEPGPP